MAQSNVAREPSMDEILASIRKIIESNEPSGPGLPANDPGPSSDSSYRSDRPYLDEDGQEDIHLTIEESVFAEGFDGIDTYAEPPAPSMESYAPQATSRTAAPAPLSLADVAARVRAASERQSQPRPPQPETRQSGRTMPEAAPAPAGTDVFQPAAAVSETRTPAVAEVTAFEPAVEELQNQVVAEPVADRVAKIAPQPEPETEVPAARDMQEAQPDTARAPAAASAREATAIVSEAVGEQVSRSFGELALALDSSPRRSFDEIAEEMLRPMLQEWLDDNLPTMVERLVREEIERVARGPRR